MPITVVDSAVPVTDVLCVLLIVGVAGGLGGLSAGFNYRDKNPLTLPFSGHEVITGFVGDIIIGQVSALASVLILSLADYELGKTLTDLKTLLKFAAVCIVSGFAGLRLIRTMSRALIEKVGEQVKSVERDVEVLRRVSGLLIEAAYMRVNKKYKEEADFCAQAIALDPKNEEAHIGLAVATSMIDEPKNFPAAIVKLRFVLSHINPDSARAFYNIACIEHLMRSKHAAAFPNNPPTKKSVLEDLANAISRSPAYRAYAASDPDFHDLHSDPEFKAAIQ